MQVMVTSSCCVARCFRDRGDYQSRLVAGWHLHTQFTTALHECKRCGSTRVHGKSNSWLSWLRFPNPSHFGVGMCPMQSRNRMLWPRCNSMRYTNTTRVLCQSLT